MQPRLPQVAGSAGHYESIYRTVNHPSEPVAVWIRFTVRKPPRRPATGSIWFTLFAPGGPTAVKITTAEPRPPRRTCGPDALAVGG